jgi:hypothetical protein
MYFLSKAEELAQNIGYDDPVVQREMELLARFPETAEVVFWTLERRARELRVRLSKPAAFSIPAGLPTDGVLLGQVMRGDVPVHDFFFPESWLEGHVLIAGGSGTGKTTTTGELCYGLIKSGKHVIIPDSSDEYCWLLDEFAPEQLGVISAKNMPLALFHNPDESPFSPDSWIQIIADMLRANVYFRDGSQNVLVKTAGDIYAERGVFEGSGDYPLVTEVFKGVNERKYSAQPRHKEWKETVLNRLQDILISFKNFNVRKSASPDRFFERSWIIRTWDLTPREHDIFINVMWAWANAHLKKRMRDRAEYILLMEEAHMTFSPVKMKRYDLGELPVIRELRMCRKFGLSIIVVNQTIFDLPGAVLGNLSTRMVFRLTNSPCLTSISRTMGLNKWQFDEIGELVRRMAVVQSADSPKPFLARIGEIQKRGRTPGSLLEERERIAMEQLDYQPSDVDVITFLFGSARKNAEADDRPRLITGDSYLVLKSICEQPYLFIEERYESLGIDRAREFKARQELHKLGMIEKPEGRLGAKWELWIPKDADKVRAWAAVNKVTIHKYKGSIFHETMVRKIVDSVECFSNEVEVVSEGEALGISGIQPDLILGLGARRVAVQVSYQSKADYEAARARELSEMEGIDLVVIVAANKTKARAIEKKIGDGSVGVKVLDFEACVSKGFDWGFILGIDSEERF